jgi:hypothetical protein
VVQSPGSDGGDFTPTSRDLEGALENLIGDPHDARAFLLVLSGDDAGRVFPLHREEHVIGRSPGADIHIDQGSISSTHAKLIFIDGRHLLVDLGSTNGTFVNDERVRSQGELQGGDVIRVGETVMSFLASRGDAASLPAIAIAHVPVDEIAPRQAPRSIRSIPSSRGFRVRDAEQNLSFRDVVGGAVRATRFVRHNGRLLLNSVLFGAALGVLSARIRPPPGTAAFEIRFVPKPSENALNQSDDNAQFFSAAEMDFRSPELVRRTLADIGVRVPSTDELVRVRDRLKFEGIALGTYRGTFVDTTGPRALEYLRRHVSNYVDFEVEKTLHVLRAQADFLKDQVERNETELTKTEALLRDFKSGHLDGLPDQAREQFTQRLNLKARQTALAAEVERTTLALGAARQKITDDDPLFQRRVQATQPYESALVDVKRKLGEARAQGLGEGHPEVQRLARQALELERLSRDTLSTDAPDDRQRVDPTLLSMRDRVADLEVTRSAAVKELARVNGDLAEIDRVVRELPDVEAKYAELTRTYAGSKALHDKLFERYKAAALDLELERSLVSARYQLTARPEAAKARLGRFFATRVFLGCLFGVVIAGTLVALRELRRFVRENDF